MDSATDAARSDTSAPTPAGLSVVGALNLMLQSRVLILGCMLGAFSAVVGVVLLLPRTYSTTSSFLPQSKKSPANLAGIAAQFGIAVPGAEPGQSPAFYAELVKSREIMGAVVDTKYVDPRTGASGSASLVDILGEDRAESAPLRREWVLNKLRREVSADVSLKAGTVDVTVRTRFPTLSMQVNQRILDVLNQFNLEKRQTQAAAERRFVARRLEEVRTELRSAEDRVQRFMQGDRDYRNSPGLNFEYQRLDREVSMRQTVFTSLAQAYEQARIDEVRDSPLITVIEQPVVPVLPDARQLIVRGAIALLAGALFGMCIAFTRYAVRLGRAGDRDELTRLRSLASETARGFLKPWSRAPRADKGDRKAS